MTSTLERTVDASAPPAPHGPGPVSRAARWRVAVRMAQRQLRRAWVSSVLVTTLVALPIAGMTGFLIFTASAIASPEERTAAELGDMEAWIAPSGVPGAGFWQVPTEPEWNGYPIDADGVMTMPDGEPLDDPTGLLAAGTEVLPVSRGMVSVATDDGAAVLPAWAGTTWDPRFAEAFVLVAGDRPAKARDAMVTPAALERLGLELGDTLRLSDGPAFTVTGTLDAAAIADGVAAVFLPEHARRAVGGTQKWYLPELELSWADVQRLNDEGGVVAYSRTVAFDPPEFSNRYYSSASTERWAKMWPLVLMLSVAALFAGYVVVMLAGAAFAVAARRQQRALAVAASVGANRRDLSRVVLLQGTALGLVGGAIGIAGGIGIAALVIALGSGAGTTMFWGFHVPWELIAAVLVFAVIVGTVSAWMPARAVGRTDALRALRGARRPQRPVVARPIWGSVLIVTGVAITLLCAFAVAAINATDFFGYDSLMRYVPAYGIVVGPIVAQFGILLSGRWLLWTASRGLSHAGMAARLASRDAAANASRTVPAFAAIAATVFIGVFALAQSSMQTAQTARLWYYDAPPGSIAVPIWPGSSSPGVLDPEDAEAGTTAALQIAHDAGADRAAVVSRQLNTVWEYPSAEEVPDDVTFTIALLGEQHLLDPEAQDYSSSFGQDPSNPISVVAAEDVRVVMGLELPASALAAYRDGAALVADGRFVSGGAIDVATFAGADVYEGRTPDNIWERRSSSPPPADPVRVARMDAIVVDAPLQPVAIAVAPSTAERLGMVLVPERVVATTPAPLAWAERDRMQAQAELLSGAAFTLAPGVEEGPPSDAAWMVPLLAAVAVLVLGVSAVALGLARFERRPDDATIAAVGGTRSLRRGIGFWQGLIIAGLGALAGAAVGVLAPIGFSIQSEGALQISDIPWWLIAAVVVALPLAIAVTNWLAPPRRPELTRRTAIT
ncbi:MFS family permease [Microbacterium sp. BE35]|uniref:ABC transporter permease n=1 Tax=Microbacterium sp. BE35 TaxID=2817773 RepID=UPI00286196F0|nr:ABC transporter permease [Microbacterium sp. BE35]MDR7189147.1 MFS family permease [Microbacterium sp. BE35]